MHNLSTISKTYGKHELKASTPSDSLSAVDPPLNGASSADSVVASAVPARMNVSSSGISAGMAMPFSIPSSTALSLPQGPAITTRPGTPSPTALRQSARLPPLNIPNISSGVGLTTEELSMRGASPIMLRQLEPLKLNPSNLSHAAALNGSNQQGSQSLNSTVVNEVHAISYDRRRRSSSAQLPLSRQLVHGHIPTRGASSIGTQGLGIHKPLPGISEPNKSKSQIKKAKAEKAKASPWRFVLKCLLISLFLSIPVVIFILMMALSGGFSTVENIEQGNSTTPTGTNFTATTAYPPSLSTA